MTKPRFKEVRGLAQGLCDYEWQGLIWSPSFPVSVQQSPVSCLKFSSIMSSSVHKHYMGAWYGPGAVHKLAT